MPQQRTLTEKVQDIKTTYVQFQEMLTTEQRRGVLADMTGSMSQFMTQAMELAKTGGDQQAFNHIADTYAALVQASINLDKVISANDRAALVAAVMANSNVSRPMLDVIDGGSAE